MLTNIRLRHETEGATPAGSDAVTVTMGICICGNHAALDKQTGRGIEWEVADAADVADREEK